MRIKKKVGTLLLLVVLMAPALATWLLFQHQKHQIKRSVKHDIMNGIDRQDLVLLKFSKSEAVKVLEWEHDKEFEFLDEMYDVVHQNSTHDSVYYWCWWDHEESQLNITLNVLLMEAYALDPNKNEQQTKLIHFLQNIYFVHNVQFNFHNAHLSEISYPEINYDVISGFSIIPSPPPRFS